MNKLFLNQEAKRSTIMLALLLTIFMILQVSIYNKYVENQKQDYIDIVGSIISRAITLNPELENELIPLVTKEISQKDKELGRKILREYGITSNLNDILFPNRNNNFGLIIPIFLLVCLLLVLNYLQYNYFFKKVRKITEAANKILDDDYTTLVNEDKEGDFSKLALEFSNVRRIIKNNINTTQNEKQYLVELLQNISHQLKTKLATMILYNDILLNRKITEEQRMKFLQDNSVQLNNMSIMIQHILKLAKLDVNTTEFYKKEESLNMTVREVVSSFEEIASDKNIKLEIYDCDNIDLLQDKFWMKEAISNIVKNAIEHTHSNGIVKVYLLNTPIYYRITIEDNGDGIDQNDIANIFNRFYKSKNSTKKDSIGIGLAISKSIIESHNGYIDVKSEKGAGASFMITFMKY